LVAGGVTFYLISVIFPGIAALISIYGLFANPATIVNQLDTIANIAPGGAIEVLHDELTRLASRGGTTLSIGFLVSLLISLWFTNFGVSALFDALNIAYEEKEKRGIIKYHTETLTFTIATIVFVLLSITVVVAVPVVLSFMPLPGGMDLFVRIARWPILLMLVASALAVLYRFGPCRDGARWRWITWGTAFGTIGWLAVSFLFSWYVANFGSYNKTYGSLGAIMGFMTWIWLSLVSFSSAPNSTPRWSDTRRTDELTPDVAMTPRELPSRFPSAGRIPAADAESPLPKGGRCSNSRVSMPDPRSSEAATAPLCAAPAPLRAPAMPAPR
jgi:membrane protein